MSLKFVLSHVKGIMFTLKYSFLTSFTVSETPSIVIEPLEAIYGEISLFNFINKILDPSSSIIFCNSRTVST